jgi:hypothetical protein
MSESRKNISAETRAKLSVAQKRRTKTLAEEHKAKQ